MLKHKKYSIILLLILVLLFLSSCGGLVDTNQISAKNLITGDNLLIKIKVKQSPALGNWTHFAIGKDLSTLSDELLKKSNIDSTKCYKNEYILVKSEKKSPFIIKKIEKLGIDEENDYRYAFFAPTARVDYQDIFFPYHLFDNAQIQYYPGYNDMCFEENQEFNTEYDIKEIYEFYNSIIEYSTQMSTQNVVTVSDNLSGNIFTVTYNPDSSSVTFKFSNK